MNIYIFRMAVVALIFWSILLVSMIRDRSRYRNCYFLMAAIAATLPVLVLLGGEKWRIIFFITSSILIILALLLPIVLIGNGVVMVRREGHHPGNLLSLFLGIFIGLGEAAFFYMLIRYTNTQTPVTLSRLLSTRTAVLMALLSQSAIYTSLNILAFMLYTLLLQTIPRKRDFDYVIIHGAGLLGGNKVSRLLADRIDKAIEIYHKDPTPPFLIPSGGKGGDESISEAEAIRNYLIAHKIPREKILLENRSGTTYENLAYSRKIIDAREGRKYTALVSSNYHVYRALRYCRRIGLKCTGIGSRVALYYYPSAMIREFIAIQCEKKHAFWFIVGWLIFLSPIALGLLGVL